MLSDRGKMFEKSALHVLVNLSKIGQFKWNGLIFWAFLVEYRQKDDIDTL